MSKQLGVKILLQYGHFFTLVLDESDAREMVADWLSGAPHLKGTKRIGDAEYEPGAWALDMASVIGMHTFPLDQVQQGPPPKFVSPGMGGWNPHMSGM